MAVRQPARKASKTRRARAAAATPAQARAHVFAPSHVKKIQIEEGRSQSRGELSNAAATEEGGAGRRRRPRRDGAENLDRAQGPRGWIHSPDPLRPAPWCTWAYGNWAQTPSDAAKGWTEDTRISTWPASASS